MSWQPSTEPSAQTDMSSAIEMIIVPRKRDLGDGFEVQRVLPFAKRRMVGPFIFFDAMGPTSFAPGHGLDVRPHPHIGLATVTYLFAGEIVHRDSLGTMQTIRPGDVNWMTAGRGITHSERTDPAMRVRSSPLFGIQSWVALPQRDEETEPSFSHHAVDELPTIEGEGKLVRLIAGSLAGKDSPVRTFSPMVYADVRLAPKARIAIPAQHQERGIFLAEGPVEIEGVTHQAGRLLVLCPKVEVTVTASDGARFMLLGGEPLDGPRHVWWNLVSSSQERIEVAKTDWRAGRFAPVPGETEFIPLPEE